MATQVHYKSDKDLIATLGALVIWIDSGAETKSGGLERISHLLGGLLADEPSVALLLVMQEGARLPDGPTRQAAADLFNDLGDRFKGLSVVLIGGGFWASALRSAVTGIGLMLQRQRAARVYTGTNAAAEAIAEQLEGIKPDEIVSACEELIARLNG